MFYSDLKKLLDEWRVHSGYNDSTGSLTAALLIMTFLQDKDLNQTVPHELLQAMTLALACDKPSKLKFTAETQKLVMQLSAFISNSQFSEYKAMNFNDVISFVQRPQFNLVDNKQRLMIARIFLAIEQFYQLSLTPEGVNQKGVYKVEVSQDNEVHIMYFHAENHESTDARKKALTLLREQLCRAWNDTAELGKLADFLNVITCGPCVEGATIDALTKVVLLQQTTPQLYNKTVQPYFLQAKSLLECLGLKAYGKNIEKIILMAHANETTLEDKDYPYTKINANTLRDYINKLGIYTHYHLIDKENRSDDTKEQLVALTQLKRLSIAERYYIAQLILPFIDGIHAVTLMTTIRELEILISMIDGKKSLEESPELFYELLLRHAHVNARLTPQGETALHLAAKKNVPDLIELLLANNANLTLKDSQGCTAIYVAAMYQQWQCVMAFPTDNEDTTDNAQFGSALLYAAQYNHTASVKYLLQKRLDSKSVAHSTKDKFFPLHHAVLHNNLDMGEAILNKFPNDINRQWDIHSPAPLHTAIINKNVTISTVQWLLKQPGLDVNIRQNGETALFMAAKTADADKVERLLAAKGIDIDAKRTPGDHKTALQIATENGHHDIAALITSRNDSMKITRLKSASTFLTIHYSAQVAAEKLAGIYHDYGIQELITVIKSAAVPPNTPAILAERLLILYMLIIKDLVAEKNHQAMEELLKLLQVDINMPVSSLKNNTLLHLAAESDAVELVKLLITKLNADITIRNSDDLTAIKLAADKNHMQCVMAFPDVSEEIAHKATYAAALFPAAFHKNVACVKFLLQKNILDKDEHAAALNHYFAIHYAIVNNLIEMAQAIINKFPNDLNRQYDTSSPAPLHVTIIDNTVTAETVQWLLQQPGLNINIRQNGETALFLAAKMGNIDKVTQLFAIDGIDVDARRTPGDNKTAQQIAEEGGHANIVALFKSRNALQAAAIYALSIQKETDAVEKLAEIYRNYGIIELVDCLKHLYKKQNIKQQLLNCIPLLCHEIRRISPDLKQDISHIIQFAIAQKENDLALNLLDIFHYGINELIIDEMTALHLAVKNGNHEFIQPLLLKHAAIDQQGKGGLTVAHLSMEQANIEMIYILLAAKANFNIKNKSGESAFFMAVHKGDEEKVLLLLSLPEIDVQAPRNPGDNKSPLIIAKEKQFTRIAALIECHDFMQRFIERPSVSAENLDFMRQVTLKDITAILYKWKNNLALTEKSNDLMRFMQMAYSRVNIPHDLFSAETKQNKMQQWQNLFELVQSSTIWPQQKQQWLTSMKISIKESFDKYLLTQPESRKAQLSKWAHTQPLLAKESKRGHGKSLLRWMTDSNSETQRPPVVPTPPEAPLRLRPPK